MKIGLRTNVFGVKNEVDAQSLKFAYSGFPGHYRSMLCQFQPFLNLRNHVLRRFVILKIGLRKNVFGVKNEVDAQIIKVCL